MGREGLWLEGRILHLQWRDGGDPPKGKCFVRMPF